MTTTEKEDSAIYDVVINHEEQYSIWPIEREIPRGWKAAGRRGSRTECLQYIEQVWVDMRPLSLRKAMEAQKKGVASNRSGEYSGHF